MANHPQFLAGVQANVAFAKQRFDSTAPVAKVALMLLPIATLLAHIASDQRRDAHQRDRATKLSRKLHYSVLHSHWRVRGLGDQLHLVSAALWCGVP